jgi:predicted phosphodiesterase
MIAIISDVHGNFPALEAVLADIDASGSPQIVCLGDIAGYYCMVNECIAALRARSVQSLLGNHDYYLVSGTVPPRSQAAARCIAYQRGIVTAENLAWLAELPRTFRIGDVAMVHGGWTDPIDEYITDIREDYFANREGTFFFSGHTHVQVVARFPTKTYCNPGSVGQPRDGDARAAYALFDDGAITLRRVSYDIDRIAAEMQRAGFDSYFYENLYAGRRIGGKLSGVTVKQEAS